MINFKNYVLSRTDTAQSVKRLAPPMSACRYVEENGLAAMLANKRLAGVTPEVNLREHVTCSPLPTLALKPRADKPRADTTRSPNQEY